MCIVQLYAVERLAVAPAAQGLLVLVEYCCQLLPLLQSRALSALIEKGTEYDFEGTFSAAHSASQAAPLG